MVDVINKMCITCNKKRPCFNYLNETQALYCTLCKTCEMIDVINKKCVKCNLKHPIFNYPNETKNIIL